MTFQEPRKFILTQEQLEWFRTSETQKKIVSYIEALNEAVVGVKLTDPCEESEVRPQLYSGAETRIHICALSGSESYHQRARQGRTDMQGDATRE